MFCSRSQKSNKYYIFNEETYSLNPLCKESVDRKINSLIKYCLKKYYKSIKGISSNKTDYFSKSLYSEEIDEYFMIILEKIITFRFSILIINRGPQECCVCYQSTLCKLECNHDVCFTCFKEMFSRNYTQCPYCRTEMKYSCAFYTKNIPIKSILKKK